MANDVALLIDEEAKASALVKEREPISPGILVEATLTQALDLSLAHPGLNEGRIKAKTFSDNSSIDAKRAINKRDPGHR